MLVLARNSHNPARSSVKLGRIARGCEHCSDHLTQVGILSGCLGDQDLHDHANSRACGCPKSSAGPAATVATIIGKQKTLHRRQLRKIPA